MLSATGSTLRRVLLGQQRFFNRSIGTSVVRAQSATPAEGGAQPPASSVGKKAPESEKGATHKPSGMERKYLVWSGKYKTAEDIPEYVHHETMERANNRARIRIANIMMVLTVLGCIAMIISGKKAAESGDSVQKQNLDWHKRYNESKEAEKK